jgi:sugar/nucleoside kinase (ribokinase family)
LSQLLLIVGEPIVAYQRDLAVHGPGADYVGPWASGSPAICAYVAGMLGTPTAFAGAVGDDARGRLMHERLSAASVDLEALVVRQGRETAWANVTYRADGEREFDFRVSASAATTLQGRELGSLPEQASWMHLSGSALVFGGALVDTAFEALERARRAGSTISVDPNVRPESLSPSVGGRLAAAIASADVVLPSAGELVALGVDEEELLAAGAVVCTTFGERGARVRQGAVVTDIPAVTANTVDSDGAGDSFAAGYITASIRGVSPAGSARYGARVAGSAVQHHGPMTWSFADVGPVGS